MPPMYFHMSQISKVWNSDIANQNLHFSSIVSGLLQHLYFHNLIWHLLKLLCDYVRTKRCSLLIEDLSYYTLRITVVKVQKFENYVWTSRVIEIACHIGHHFFTCHIGKVINSHQLTRVHHQRKPQYAI